MIYILKLLFVYLAILPLFIIIITIETLFMWLSKLTISIYTNLNKISHKLQLIGLDLLIKK